MSPTALAGLHAVLRALIMWYLIYCILCVVPSTDLMWFLYKSIVAVDGLFITSLLLMGLYAGHKERRG